MTNYKQLKSSLFDNGNMVFYEINDPKNDIFIKGMITITEIFYNSTEAKSYDSEYFAFNDRRTEYIDRNQTNYGLTQNNTLIEIFTELRIFKDPPLNITPFGNSIYLVCLCIKILQTHKKEKKCFFVRNCVVT